MIVCNLDLRRQPEFRFPVTMMYMNMDTGLFAGEEKESKSLLPENRRTHASRQENNLANDLATMHSHCLTLTGQLGVSVSRSGASVQMSAGRQSTVRHERMIGEGFVGLRD
jgi:hypothetical protein